MSDPLDIDLDTPLSELTPEQMEHLQLGLVNCFDADLSRPPEARGFFVLETEHGDKLGVHPLCTVRNVWDIATRASGDAGTVPAAVPGAVNVLHHSSN